MNAAVGLLLLLLGVSGLLFGPLLYFRALLRIRASRDWPFTSATILESRLSKSQGRWKRHLLTISFSYEAEGRRYRSDRASFGDHGGREAKRMWDKYTAGEVHPARYDPSRPDIAILEPGSPPADLLLLSLPSLIPIWGGLQLLQA